MKTPHNNDGGEAFPGKYEYIEGNLLIDGYSPGMTLRDYFAAAALQGLLAHIIGVENANGSALKYAECAYEYADAMLAARKEGA
jgi:hypothetical protein